jgi:hypothetical protein
MSLTLIGSKNYLKRDPSSGKTSISAPTTLGGYGLYVNSYTVSHNLGYIPRVRVYYENSASDGKLYPAGGSRSSGTYTGLPANSIICLWELDTTNLTIYLESKVAQVGSRNIYWIIYQDF